MTNGFRDSYGEHSHRKTRPVINVSLITLTFLQVDFHTYPIIFALLGLLFADCFSFSWLISPDVTVYVNLRCPESCKMKGLDNTSYKHSTVLHGNKSVVDCDVLRSLYSFEEKNDICNLSLLFYAS